jgi:hypothetical protein
MSQNQRTQTSLAATNALSSDALDKVHEAIEKTLTECSVEAVKTLPAMKKAIVLANGVTAMRQALSDQVMNQIFMPLQSTKLGFRTDKDRDGGYPMAIVRECIIEAMMRGFMPVGNEFNIIAENFYATKEGFMRKCPELDGVTNIEHYPGVPHNAGEKGALVPYTLKWKYKGAPMKIERSLRQLKNDKGDVVEVIDERIPVKVNSGQGADAILGKAKRKILAQMYDVMTGSTLSDGDPDTSAIDTVGVSVPETPQQPANEKAVQELINKHGKKNGATSAAADATAPTTEPSDDRSDIE